MNDKEQIENLMNELLEFAKAMLDQHGEFHPFGGYLRENNITVHVGVSADIGLGKGTGTRRMEILTHKLKGVAENPRTIGIGTAANVTIAKTDDASASASASAIKFFLEHRNGYCAEVFFNYELTDKGTLITNITAQQGNPEFFHTQLDAES